MYQAKRALKVERMSLNEEKGYHGLPPTYASQHKMIYLKLCNQKNENETFFESRKGFRLQGVEGGLRHLAS
jgi:hypothetical protein